MRIESCAVCLLAVFIAIIAYSNVTHQWVSITSSSMDSVKQIVKSEVDQREGFSTAQEEATNLRTVNDEIARGDAAYKNGIAAAKAEFTKTKNRRDDLTAQFQGKASEVEVMEKDIKNLKTGMENCDSQVSRFEQDIKIQQESLKKWLKTEKQGEALIAVIYTRGFKDTKHELDSLADKASAPHMTTDMGVYVRSYTKVINNALAEDFIQATIEGTAKWNGEEPVLIELGKGTNGTAYLRVKRYELYPFQESTNGKVKNGGVPDKVKVALISSMYDLESFLSQNGYTAANLDLSRMQSMLAEAVQTKKLAGEGLTDQVNSFQEKIAALQEKITNAKGDKEIQGTTLKKKETQLEKLKGAVEALKGKREEAEKAFQLAQVALSEKNRVRETIIVKTVLTTPKGSQTPAEAASESIIDKLEEVKNDARTQHSTSTTTVVNAQLVDETSSQAVTEAKITGVKLISFINEGDSVKVKMAFRVRMELGELNQNIGINDVKEANGFRFAEQTALDTRTGLMWARNGNVAGKDMNWIDAMSWAKNLNYGGYSDWRLPTKEELESFSMRGRNYFNANGFNDVQSSWYWSSSTHAYGTDDARVVYLWDGSVSSYNKSYSNYYVWPVRSGQ